MDFWEDGRVQAGIIGACAGLFMGSMAVIGTVFSVPSPSQKQVWRVVLETVLGVAISYVAAYTSAIPVAAFLNGLAAKVVPGFTAVDNLAAALLVGFVFLKVLPVALDLAIATAKKRMEAKPA